MRYLVLLKAAQPDSPPPAELMEAIAALGGEATTAGALLDTAGLAPSAAGAKVTLGAGGLHVTDGPLPGARQGGGGRVDGPLHAPAPGPLARLGG